MNWFISRCVPTRIGYPHWLRMRSKSLDESGEALCYCGHTDMCSCADPDKEMFKMHIRAGNILLFDKRNGWKSAEDLETRKFLWLSFILTTSSVLGLFGTLCLGIYLWPIVGFLKGSIPMILLVSSFTLLVSTCLVFSLFLMALGKVSIATYYDIIKKHDKSHCF